MLQRKEADGLIFLGHRLPKEAAGARPRDGARACAPVVNGCEFSPRLGIPSVHIDNADGRVRGDGPPLPSRSSPHRHRHRAAGQPAQPRPPARRDARARRSSGPSATSSSCTATSRSSRARSQRERLLGAPGAADGDLLLQRRDGDGRDRDGAAARRSACPDDLSVVGFDDIRFAQLHGSAADDDRAADARDRRRYGPPAARDPAAAATSRPSR